MKSFLKTRTQYCESGKNMLVLLDFLPTVKAAPHECIMTSQP